MWPNKGAIKKMKKIWSVLAGVVVLGAVSSMSASPICPNTVNTGSADCGAIITINAGGSPTFALVAGGLPYDGSDDVLIGVVNNSGAVFTGAITLVGSGNGGGLFAFDGDGICTFTNAAYCATAATKYEGPLNTFSGITTTSVFDDTGTVNITGLAAGATTYFSLESDPRTIVGTFTPEPATLFMLAGGMLCLIGLARKRRKAEN
jgi:hypothetical protein